MAKDQHHHHHHEEDEEGRHEIPFDDSLDSFLCIDGVPAVPKDKLEKLTNVLLKVFRTFGKFKEDSLYFPSNPDGSTKGYLYLEFESAEEMSRACKLADNYRLDKAHVFRAYPFTDIFKYANLPDTWEAPKKEPFKEKENLKSWLLDPQSRDQLVIRFGEDTSVLWFAKNEDPANVITRRGWTDSQVQWSSKGSYLATFRRQGIELWGGPEWSHQGRFSHFGVRLIDFSPNEQFMVTWSNEPLKGDSTGKNMIIWDIRSGRPLRTFESSGDAWPVFKWSHDDKYFARLGPDVISVYQTPDMGLLDKKSIQADQVKGFSWSPKQNILAFWTPESGNSPARVTLMDIPSRNILRTKNLFNVLDCKFYWQNEGHYLIAKVTRSKTKKSSSTNLELFRVKEKEIPVEVFEMPDEHVPVISWEPKGSHFALIHGEAPNTQVSFYSVEKTIKHLKTLDKKLITRLEWSPLGQFLILATLGSNTGTLEFWNCKDMESMATGEHFMCTDLEWDPSGRYLISYVSAWKSGTDFGFKVWDFKGKLLYDKVIDKFFHVSWRPRPPTLLSKEKIKEIKKNRAVYEAKYLKLDKSKDSKVSSAARDHRRKLFSEWESFMEDVRRQHIAEKPGRVEILGFDPDAEQAKENVEESVEEIIDETRTLVK